MAHNDVSESLLSGFESALDNWASRFDGERDSLYWVLRVKVAETNGGPGRHSVLAAVADDLKRDVHDHLEADAKYWDNVRYANLDRVTQLWGVVVNSVRVAANSHMATDVQKKVFAYPVESLVAFFRSARERMEVADQLFHCFKPMPAPECQTLAALLNVHAVARLDAEILTRLVRLLDDEGPLTDEESAALDTLANTGLVDAAFRGLRGEA
jgi:hypothetical protein